MLATNTHLHQNGLEHAADERGAIPVSLACASLAGWPDERLEPKQFSFSEGSSTIECLRPTDDEP